MCARVRVCVSVCVCRHAELQLRECWGFLMMSFHISVMGESRTKARLRSLLLYHQAYHFLSSTALSFYINAETPPPCVCLTPAIIHVNKCLLMLFCRLFAKMHPPPPPCSLSQSTVFSICRWRVSSNNFVNLARCFFFFSSFCPETIPGRVVGGLYTGNGAELLDFCFKKIKTHVNFRGRMGKSG